MKQTGAKLITTLKLLDLLHTLDFLLSFLARKMLGALIRTHILQNADYAYNTCHDSTRVTNVIILLIVSIFRSLTDTHPNTFSYYLGPW